MDARGFVDDDGAPATLVVVEAALTSGDVEVFRGPIPTTGVIGFPMPVEASGEIKLKATYELEPGTSGVRDCEIQIAGLAADQTPSADEQATVTVAADRGSDVGAESEIAPDRDSVATDSAGSTDDGAVDDAVLESAAPPSSSPSTSSDNRRLIGIIGAVLLMIVSAASLVRYLIRL